MACEKQHDRSGTFMNHGTAVLTRRAMLRSTASAGLAVSVSALARAQEADTSTFAAIEYANPQTYDIEQRLQFTNGTCDLRTVELWLPIAQTGDGQQVETITLTPENAQLRTDRTGTAKVARLFRTRGLPGHNGSLELAAKYQVTVSEATTDHDAVSQETFEQYASDEKFRLFTRAEAKIETRDAAIRQQAAELRKAHARPYAVALAAYEWILDRTRYQLVDDLQGALFCLKEQYGECCEYSALFVALCRAAGIPARPVVGFRANETDGWHVWAEFMCPRGAWIPVDASLGDGSAYGRDYYFGSMDNRRVALTRTFDIAFSRSRTKVEVLQMGATFWQASTIGTAPQSTGTVTALPTAKQDPQALIP